MDPNTIVWQDPPPKKPFVGRPARWKGIAETLIANPNRWAHVAIAKGHTSQHRIYMEKYGDPNLGFFEGASRTRDDGRVDLYARWVEY